MKPNWIFNRDEIMLCCGGRRFVGETESVLLLPHKEHLTSRTIKRLISYGLVEEELFERDSLTPAGYLLRRDLPERLEAGPATGASSFFQIYKR